jgi:hypothetical protein
MRHHVTSAGCGEAGCAGTNTSLMNAVVDAKNQVFGLYPDRGTKLPPFAGPAIKGPSRERQPSANGPSPKDMDVSISGFVLLDCASASLLGAGVVDAQQ